MFEKVGEIMSINILWAVAVVGISYVAWAGKTMYLCSDLNSLLECNNNNSCERDDTISKCTEKSPMHFDDCSRNKTQKACTPDDGMINSCVWIWDKYDGTCEPKCWPENDF